MQNIQKANIKSVKSAFDLTGRVAIITGGAGLLGTKHAEAISEMGGIPVLLDLDSKKTEVLAEKVKGLGLHCDITKPREIRAALSKILHTCGRIDILINNAANNPKVEATNPNVKQWARLENFPLTTWHRDMAVGLTGAFLCSKIIGREMAQRGKGVILNIASELAIIAPDQRLYQQPNLPQEQQPVKPISYSVVKAGLLGLTHYLATYWSDKGVRVNALSPGGVYTNQNDAFVQRLSQMIPLGRMAHADEYKAAVVFLVSDASSYMTGANLVMDGGRTCW